MLRQVHGRRVLRLDRVTPGERADGTVWRDGDPVEPVAAVRTADCVPLLLGEREGRAAAAVHAGWRGTAAGIARAAVELLAGLGVGPERLVAALGPAIGGCCYEVGAEVAEAIVRASGEAALAPGRGPGGGPRVDLRAANRLQLESAGVPASAIHDHPGCTACRGDLFFSHRAEGARAGRMLAVIGPAASGGSGRVP